MKTYIIIGGLAKAGTTSLFDYLNETLKLRQTTKELGLFYSGSELRVALKKKGQRLRRVKFQCPNSEIVIDASPHYLHDEHFAFFMHRIQDLKKNGDKIRLIIIKRDPIERVISQYKHHIRDNAENCALPDILFHNSYANRKLEIPNLWTGYDYIGNSKYAKNLEKLKFTLTDEELLVLDFSHLRSNSTILKVHKFLNLKQIVTIEMPRSNFSGLPKSIFGKCILYVANSVGNILLNYFQNNERIVMYLRKVRSLLHRNILSVHVGNELLTVSQIRSLKETVFKEEYDSRYK